MTGRQIPVILPPEVMTWLFHGMSAVWAPICPPGDAVTYCSSDSAITMCAYGRCEMSSASKSHDSFPKMDRSFSRELSWT